MHLGLTQPLRSTVTQTFTRAKASQSLIFSHTHLIILHNSTGIPFQLRYCPALSKKPTDNKQSEPTRTSQLPHPDSESSLQPPKEEKKKEKKRFDPFEDPVPSLLVARIPDPNNHSHNLVLNKFPVISNHFIISTRQNKPQTGLLDESDLGLTYATIQAYQDDDERHRLYAFFNSGEFSGASQPHRHLQFLPVEDMRGSSSSSSSSSSDGEWDLLCNRMTTPLLPLLPPPEQKHSSVALLHDPALPVIHIATPISPSTTSAQLHEKYLTLLRAAVVLTRSQQIGSGSGSSSRHPTSTSMSDLLSPTSLASAIITSNTSNTSNTTDTNTKTTTISYNLALTSKIMAILPRRAEDATIPDLMGESGSASQGGDNTSSSTGTGIVSINGTVLAGTLMVRNQDEWDAVRGKPELLDRFLRQVAWPRWEGAKI